MKNIGLTGQLRSPVAVRPSARLSARWTFAASWLVAIMYAALATGQPAPVGAPLEPSGALPDLTGEVEVIVGPGGKQLDPIAIADAHCKAAGASCASAVEVLRRDLEITGYFQLLPPKTFLADKNEPMDAPAFPNWFNVGAKYLVHTEVLKSGTATNLKFRVYNVLEKKQVAVSPSQFTGLRKNEVRGKVHEFANALLKALTGKPGVFGSRIAYSAKTGDWTRGVFTMDMDGHNAGSVVKNGAINSLPSFSRDGLVYTVQGDRQDPQIWVGDERISHDSGRYRKAVLGPGGQYAVSVDRGEGSDIWLMDKSGKLLKNLTNGEGDNVSPSWSKGGSRIAFTSNRTGTPQVWVMNADGSGQRRLTMLGSYNSTPDFGPDNTIVFAGLDSGTSDIFTVDLAGNIRRLTQDQGWNKDPTWSADGRWVAFVSDRNGGRIFIMTADGRYQFAVSKKPCSCATPDWGG